MSRQSSRTPVLAFLLVLLTACGGGDGGVPAGPSMVQASAIALVSGGGQAGIAGLRLGDSIVVRAVDARGAPVAGVLVHFAVGAGVALPANATTDAQGRAATAWTLGDAAGEQALSVTAAALAPVQLTARAEQGPPTAVTMLKGLDAYVASTVQQLQAMRPNNQHLASYIDAKLAMLRRAGFAAEVVTGRRFIEGGVASVSGRVVPIAAVFALDPLRGEAERSVRALEEGLPVLEPFVGMPFPTPAMRVWEGFTMGNSGGGGSLFMEDRATYETRTPAERLPYEAILLHEMSHSYTGNEGLTQYLELMLYNRVRGASPDASTWVYTRAWTPGLDANEGVHALLDVARLIGPDAMARAYRRLVTTYPPYGSPLSAEVRQAFLDETPSALRDAVSVKLGRVTF